MLSIYFRSLVLRQCCIDGHSANQYVQIKAALWSHSGYDAEQQERKAGRVGLPPPVRAFNTTDAARVRSQRYIAPMLGSRSPFLLRHCWFHILDR